MTSRSKYRVADFGFRYAAERFNLCPDKANGVFDAVLDGGFGGCDVVRLLAGGVVLSLGLVVGAPCAAADVWGGSLAVTSDYIVRGISRSYDRAALQLDLHYLNTSGFVAGLFASNTQIDPDQPRDVELDAFVGFAWSASSDWRAKILASHYAYPWNRAGSGYNYDELDADLAYQEWLDVRLVYSPNAPRHLRWRGLVGVTSESAEVNLQRPVLGRLSATAGIGYSHIEGADTEGYAYWSVGAVYTFAPVSLSVSYVKTTAEAKALFYNAEADGRWTGTVIWRF